MSTACGEAVACRGFANVWQVCTSRASGEAVALICSMTLGSGHECTEHAVLERQACAVKTFPSSGQALP